MIVIVMIGVVVVVAVVAVVGCVMISVDEARILAIDIDFRCRSNCSVSYSTPESIVNDHIRQDHVDSVRSDSEIHHPLEDDILTKHMLLLSINGHILIDVGEFAAMVMCLRPIGCLLWFQGDQWKKSHRPNC